MSQNMNNHDELTSLSDTWQGLSEGPSSPRPTIDLQRKQRNQRWFWLMESVIAAVGALIGVVLIIQGPVLIGIAVLLYSLFGGILAWKARSMNLHVLGHSISDYLAERRAILRIKRNNDWAGALMCTAAAVFLWFVRGQQSAELSRLDLGLLVGFLIATVFFVIRAWRGQQGIKAADKQAASIQAD